MDLIHAILNLSALLLWLSWRSQGFVQPQDFRGGTLLSTLKQTDRQRLDRRVFLTSLVTLLGLRSLLYWQIGPAVDWSPYLSLGVINLPFRSDYFDRMLLFSGLSFGCWLGWFYLGLLLVSLLNRRLPDANPWQGLVRRQLGAVDALPVWLKLLLPALAALLLWLVLGGYFAYLRILPPVTSGLQLLAQAGVMSLAVYLAWKGWLVALLLLHVLHSYVYLGNQAIWAYLGATTQNLLAPLRRLPCRAGKFDFSPFLALLLVLLADHLLRNGWRGDYGLLWLYQRAGL